MIKFLTKHEKLKSIVGDMLEKLSSNIKFFREQYGLTQKELAQKVDVSRSVVAKWENEAVLPDLYALMKLSELFKVSLDYLVGRPHHQEDLLLEMNRIYQTNDQLTMKQFDIIDYIHKNDSLQEALYKLTKLPLKDRKAIEKIFLVTIEQFFK